MGAILNYFNPNKTPSYLKEHDVISIWQEKALQFILLISASVAWIGVILSAILKLNRTYPQLNTVLIIYLVVIHTILLLRFISYKKRTHLIAVLLSVASIVLLQVLGVNGTVSLVLISAPIFTAILINFRSAVFYTVISVVIIALSGFGFVNNLFPYPDNSFNSLASPLAPINWIIWALFTFVVLYAVSSSINQILTNYSQNAKQQIHLSKALDSERSKLAIEVDKQTKNLQDRLRQLHTVAEISAEINKTLDSNELIIKVVEMVKTSFDLYYVGIFLIDDYGEFAVLKAGSGEEGQKMLAAEHKLAVNGPSMIGWATGKKQSRIALDVGEDAVHFNNPYLPFTHSEMAIPLVGKNERVLGAMTIQSHRQNDFDEDDILILQNVANSLAVALENAELFQQSQQALKEIEMLNQLYIKRTWNDFLIENSELTAQFQASDTIVSSNEVLKTISIPIKLRNQVIGEIEIDVPASKIENYDSDLIDVLSDQIAYAMENTRLMEQTIRQATHEQKANELSTEFFKAVRIEDVIRTAIREISTIPYVSEVNIQVDPMNSTKANGKEV
ncbi:MAG: hypothetical protein CL609_22720 [Anaerolineaceae bacterium]|nr:hypothetical protein [Anaerolineaceae bacterium]